ncbi:hypothetical protein B9G98_02075 [Wickerhamiella sorbophila]|uniref:Uncharacterized protein n=1 Tax=Wickerhamiella sorbophila TaxID=45607 RepID=A0A2T0FHJ4_9ASCO|nr:hypothetical protein B9G98_02075 [Wickerhamiella sorbophila]PRT54455.1 hypothetical protein B9G98_02075 [Wickerhamiella sorbophila]
MELTLAEIDQQEANTILQAFNSDIAFEIGCRLRTLALKEFDRPALLQIVSATGLVYFQASSRPGTIIDNQFWAERKRRTVLHFYRSTFYLGTKLRIEGRELYNTFKLPEDQYSLAGGGFPIRVRGTEGVQAVIVVSGLKQHEDHDLCYRALREYIESAEEAALSIKPSKEDSIEA